MFYPKLRSFYAPALKGKAISIIDVGANKGQSIDFFRNINNTATIFAFEPNHKLYGRLLQKYESVPGVTIINKGISNMEGKLLFHENIMDETSTFEALNFDSDYLKKKAKVLGVAADQIITDSYEVDVTTLSNFLSSNPGLFFDVLKIDVEGHELQALQGLFGHDGNKRVPVRYIQLESHNDDMYLNNNQQQEIEDLLTKNNFVPAAKIKHGFGDFHELIFENKGL